MSTETAAGPDDRAAAEKAQKREVDTFRWFADNVPNVTAELALDAALRDLHKGNNETKGQLQTYFKELDPQLLRSLASAANPLPGLVLGVMQKLAAAGVNLTPHAVRSQLAEDAPFKERLGHRLHELGKMLTPGSTYPVGSVDSMLVLHEKAATLKKLVDSGVHVEAKAAVATLPEDVRSVAMRAATATLDRAEAKSNLNTARGVLGAKVGRGAAKTTLVGAGGVALGGAVLAGVADMDMVQGMLTSLAPVGGAVFVKAVVDKLERGGQPQAAAGNALGDYRGARKRNSEARSNHRGAQAEFSTLRQAAKKESRGLK